MNKAVFFLSAIASASMAILPATAQDEKSAAICAEAEVRYVDLFGHSSNDENGVTIVMTYKYKFCPSRLTVPVGTTVRWVNVDKRTSHSVILKGSKIPESDRIFPEELFEFTFQIPGPQDILCGPHWETQKMLGMITVEP